MKSGLQLNSAWTSSVAHWKRSSTFPEDKVVLGKMQPKLRDVFTEGTSLGKWRKWPELHPQLPPLNTLPLLPQAHTLFTANPQWRHLCKPELPSVGHPTPPKPRTRPVLSHMSPLETCLTFRNMEGKLQQLQSFSKWKEAQFVLRLF